MSDLGSSLYGYPAVVTPQSTATNGTGPSGGDPAGPFTALYVTTAGTLIVRPYSGPGAGTTVNLGSVPLGLYRFPVRAVISSSPAVCFGLCANGQAVKVGS